MNTKKAKEGLIYLYCITDKVPKLKEIENLVDKPYFIYHQSLYAIVNKVKESEFDEENLKRNLADLEWIMKDACVIPFKFATIFNTEDNLKAMLSQHLKEFKALLIKLEDKEEWGVKIYCNSEKLKENLMQEDEQLLPKEVTERNDEMILNSAFLINKDKVGDFLNIVEDIRAKYTDKGLFFDCTGPWPPYNFCNPKKGKIHNG